jgi:hypothetical protein
MPVRGKLCLSRDKTGFSARRAGYLTASLPRLSDARQRAQASLDQIHTPGDLRSLGLFLLGRFRVMVAFRPGHLHIGSMRVKFPSALAVSLIAVAAFMGMAGIYSGAYVMASIGKEQSFDGRGTLRMYRSGWVARLFIPAAIVDSAATGQEVRTAYDEVAPRFGGR